MPRLPNNRATERHPLPELSGPPLESIVEQLLERQSHAGSPRKYSRHPTRLFARLRLGLFLFDLLVGLVWAPLLIPFLFATAALWRTSTGSRTYIARTARDLALPLASGLTLICGALFALNSIDALANPQQVARDELWLAHTRLTLEQATRLSLLRALLLGTALIVLIAAIPEFKPLRRFKRGQAGLRFTKSLLLVLTTFSVYAQPPLQDQLERAYARSEHTYRVALNRELTADAQSAAAQALRTSVPAMKDRRRAAALVGSIAGKAVEEHDPVLRAENARAIEQRVYAAAQTSARSGRTRSGKTPSLGSTPITNAKFDQERHIAFRRTTLAHAAQQRAKRSVDRASAQIVISLEQGNASARQIQLREVLAEVPSLLLGRVVSSLPIPVAAADDRMVVDDLIDNFAADHVRPRIENLLRKAPTLARSSRPLLPNAEIRRIGVSVTPKRDTAMDTAFGLPKSWNEHNMFSRVDVIATDVRITRPAIFHELPRFEPPRFDWRYLFREFR
jgi:hypothetical protein